MGQRLSPRKMTLLGWTLVGATLAFDVSCLLGEWPLPAVQLHLPPLAVALGWIICGHVTSYVESLWTLAREVERARMRRHPPALRLVPSPAPKSAPTQRGPRHRRADH